MTGIQSITWTGFANQTFTIKPATSSALTLPPIQVGTLGKTVYYTDAIRVEDPYIPKLPANNILHGPWYVQRQIRQGFDWGKSPEPSTVVETVDLAIDSQGIAAGKPGSLVIALAAEKPRWVHYQLARWEIVLGPGGPNKSKTTLHLLDEPVAIIPIPPLGISAYTSNTYRPLPCEFETVKFELLGKQGQVLQTIKGGEYPPINVPPSEAKTQSGPQLTYPVRWTVKRINDPNFPPTQGYIVQSGLVQNVFIADLSPVVSGLNLIGPIGQEFTLAFNIDQAVGSGFTTRELCLGNVVTNGKFTSKDRPASLQAETNLALNW